MDKLTKEELRRWKQDPVTLKVLKQIQDRADFYSTELNQGITLYREMDEPGGTPWTVGVLYGVSLIFNIEAEEGDENVSM